MRKLGWFVFVLASAAIGCPASSNDGSQGTSGTGAGTQSQAGTGAGAGAAGSSAGNGGAGGTGSTTAGHGGGGAGGTGSTDCNRAVPLEHRPSAEACDDTRPPSMPAVDGGITMDGGFGIPEYCASDDECTDQPNGRCESFRGDQHCTYDECTKDDECDTGGPCGCEKAFWSDANACLEGNCKTDSDCGAEGFCSPTLSGCGNYSGVVGYYCHTCEDECVNDSDCTDPAQGGGPGYCMYSPETAHWVCGYSHCVG